MGQSNSNQAPTHVVREGSEFVAYMIIPPDGGWGWIIVFISFIGFVFLDGITFSFGLLRKRIAESLSINTTNAAIVGSAFAGTTFASGVFACAIGNRYGFRIVMIVGAVILVNSMVIITFLHNIYEMCGVYGFIGGIGGGFIMISLILPCGFYFDKKRPLAMGLSSSGTGVGAIVFPPMIEAFVNTNGWRNTLLFEAGIISMFLILGIFLRPIEPIKVHMKRTMELDETESLEEQFVSSIDNASLRNNSMRSHLNGSLSNSATKHPTLSTIAVANRRSITLEDAPQEMLQRFQRMASSKHGRAISSQLPLRKSPAKKSSVIEMVYKPRESIITKMFKPQDNPGARPLYRSDVLYGGSIMRLETYTEKDTEIEYHLDVTRPATEKDITEEVNHKCLLCPEAMTRGLKTLINIKLLKSPTFVCFSFSAFFVYFAFHVPFLYAGEKLRHYGIGQNKRLLICLCGFGVASGRILSGIILMVFPNFGALTFLIISCCTAGLSIIAFTFYEHLLYHAVCITTYGFTVGIFLPVRSIIIVDLLGLNQLTSATGMVIIFQGFGSVLGPPTADFLKQNLNNVNAPFHVAGFGLLLSSLLLLLMKMIDKYLKKRRPVDQG